MNRQQVIECQKLHHMDVYNRYPVVLSHGSGVYAYDIDGKEYIDFLAGIAVNALGYSHPGVVSAITAQASKMMHCSNLFYTEVQAVLASKLASLSGLDKVFFTNSGAEAVEGAIKLARKYGKSVSPSKTFVVSAKNSFHGRTFGALSATGQQKYREKFQPLVDGFKHVDYDSIEAIERAVDGDTCAVILEPIQGEGGIIVPGAGYLKKVSELCKQNGAMFIIDEIQTGMGRTGLMFAYQREGIQPDVITLGKGLGGGFPIGAFIAGGVAAAVFEPGDHGSTFGGNALACAAASAVIAAFDAEMIVKNVNIAGKYLKEQLDIIKGSYPELISEVRGYGLMIGIETTVPAKDIVLSCLAGGAIINNTSERVLRITPPLNITAAHIDRFIGVFGKVLSEIRRRNGLNGS